MGFNLDVFMRHFFGSGAWRGDSSWRVEGMDRRLLLTGCMHTTYWLHAHYLLVACTLLTGHSRRARRQATSYRLQVTSYKLQVREGGCCTCKLQVTSYKL